MLKLLTLNTWQEREDWRSRWEIIFSGLKLYQPDLIAFQEVFNMDWADEAAKRAGYPHVIKSGEPSGLVYFSKYPALESECLKYQTKSPTEEYARYTHFALLEISGKRVACFNTHLSWRADEDAVRQGQVTELLEFVDRRSGGMPTLLTGDFNSAANKPALENVLKLCIDTFAAHNPKVAGLTWDYQNPYAARAKDRMEERRIDYILGMRIAPEKIRASKLVFDRPNEQGVFASDHFGVMSEIEI